MPYVSEARAASLDAGAPMLRSGDLAYVLHREIARYFAERHLDYQGIADVRGAVGAALNEFERRVAEPYEDTKIASGADCYADLEEEAGGG